MGPEALLPHSHTVPPAESKTQPHSQPRTTPFLRGRQSPAQALSQVSWELHTDIFPTRRELPAELSSCHRRGRLNRGPARRGKVWHRPPPPVESEGGSPRVWARGRHRPLGGVPQPPLGRDPRGERGRSGSDVHACARACSQCPGCATERPGRAHRTALAAPGSGSLPARKEARPFSDSFWSVSNPKVHPGLWLRPMPASGTRVPEVAAGVCRSAPAAGTPR